MNMEHTCWDFEILRGICNERDRELIKCIPIPAMERDDSWFWIRDEKGIFTVRSCYKWLQGHYTSNHMSFWKRLWSLNVIYRCFSIGSREQCVLIGMIGWSIWNRRNKSLWEKVNGSVFGVLAAAHNLLF